MKDIILQPSECWEYAQENRIELMTDNHIIATEYEFGVEICLSVQDNLPVFEVFVDDESIHTAFAFNEEDCTEVAEELYNDYLDDFLSTVTLNQFKNDVDEQEEAEHEAIDLQESQIDLAIEDFLDVICEGFDSSFFTVKQLEEIKDHFCEYIARKYNKQVYRPMYLTDSAGYDFYVDYPYQAMIFEDEGNPIYA